MEKWREADAGRKEDSRELAKMAVRNQMSGCRIREALESCEFAVPKIKKS
jgi:hypothetical protein